MRKRWYVVAEADPQYCEEEDRIWTVSLDPRKTGWKTDSAMEGYGLTKKQAQFLADAANEKLDRDPGTK